MVLFLTSKRKVNAVWYYKYSNHAFIKKKKNEKKHFLSNIHSNMKMLFKEKKITF